MEVKKCLNCEKDIIKYPINSSRYNKVEFCSRKCCIEYHIEKVNRTSNGRFKPNKNEYILNGDIVKIKIFSRYEENVATVKIDRDDLDRVKKEQLYYSSSGYAMISGKKTLHSLIVGVVKGKDIDHISGDKLDNRKGNLRHISRSLNNLNRNNKVYSKSGVKGISFDRSRMKWSASLSFEGKRILNKRFNTKEEATEARKIAYEGLLKKHKLV